MSYLTQALIGFLGLVTQYAPTVKVNVGQLPLRGGLAITLAGNSITETGLGFEQYITLDIILNGKGKDQKALLNLLSDLHYRLGKTPFEYPNGEGWNITNIASNALPCYLGEEEQYFLYGSSFKVYLTIY